jgi:hypothetical protein
MAAPTMLPELDQPRELDRPPSQTPAADPAPVWLQRLSLVVFVLFCFLIGGFLTVLPWTPDYWVHNGWLMAHPSINAVLQQGWVRGVISGLGLIDLWIAVSELLHYRDYRPAPPPLTPNT